MRTSTVSSPPVRPALGVGTYTVVATATDANGGTADGRHVVLHRRHRRHAKPVIGAVSPAAYSTTGTASPVITAAFTGAPHTGVTVTVDGAVVSSRQDGVVITVTPGPLAAGVHQVIVTATNAGGSTSKAWSFTVQGPAGSGSAACIVCHDGLGDLSRHGPGLHVVP